MSITIEIECTCITCGTSLDANISASNYYGEYVADVVPCDNCLAEAEQEGMRIESEANMAHGQ